MTVTVHTQSVYSKLTDSFDIPSEIQRRLPKEWKLSEHQLQTYKAILDPSVEVVFNTALTGDGKSLASYLPVLTNDYHGFGMYPTIELLRDQTRQFEDYCRAFKNDIVCLPLWGSEITRLAKEHGFKERGEWLVSQFKNHDVILTNPDIFNLVMNYRYRTFIYNDAELLTV
jgi:CRISPR-associated endonuclease/helicase Cas3